MKNIYASRKFNGLKYKITDVFRENKKSTLFYILFCLIGLLTGIFTAIKYANGASLINFNDFSLSQYLAGELGSKDLFFSRLISSTVITVIICLNSFSIYLIPISFLLITYKAYLISLNCSLIIIVNGLGGIVTCLLIIFPCQIIGLLILALFCAISCKRAIVKRKYGTSCKILDKFLIVYFLLIILNIIETILLYFFSSRIILVL